MASTDPQLPHLGPILEPRSERDQFDAPELAIVLSHYDLGQIEQIREYRRTDHARCAVRESVPDASRGQYHRRQMPRRPDQPTDRRGQGRY